jgi:glycosyltransferase involved in cell wall biosynthesis
MKIGIDIRLIGKKRTGDETVIFNLVKNLVKIGSEHEFELFTDTMDVTTLEKISLQLGITGKENFKITSLFSKNRFVWNIWTLPIYLRKNPVDVYHTQYITPWFVPKKIKLVTVVHDISFNFFPQFIKFSDLFFLKILIPISLKRADRIVSVSEFTRKEIIDFYKINPKKVVCVYNAIGEEFLSNNVSSKQLMEVKNKYKLPERFILYMGTLQPRKNIPQLIEAFAQIKNALSDIELVICGNKQAGNYDWMIDRMIAQKKLEKNVIFPGFIEDEDKKNVFGAASVFAFPSLYEGFGIPPLEAMSQNVPVICSDIPSLKEIIQNSALYFDTASLNDFSQKLQRICTDNDLRSKLIVSGRLRIDFFSWEKSANKMLAIYKEISYN